MKLVVDNLNEVLDKHVKQSLRAHVIEAINATHLFLHTFPGELLKLETHLRMAREVADEQVFKDVIDFHLKALRAIHENYHRFIAENEDKILELNKRLAELGEQEGIPIKGANEVV